VSVQAVACAACRTDVGPAALYVLGPGDSAQTYCEACATAAPPEWARDGRRVKSTVCRRCGRKRYYQGSALWPHAYCTEACRLQARRERSRHPRARLEATCLCCGRGFSTTRADGRYCSPACRQGAYRQRATTAG
jgi:hypothetical protein